MDPFTPQPWETVSNWTSGSPRHLYSKALDAKQGGERAWSVMSRGEKIAVALVLNKPEWLAKEDYTIGEALTRTGEELVMAIPRIEYLLRNEIFLNKHE